MGKLIGNVAKDPGNAKFRRLRLGNPKIKAVVAAPGAADLLALVGFVPEQGSFGGYFNERWLVLPEGDDGSRAHDAASLIWSVLLPQGGPPAPAAAAKDPLDRFWQVFLPSEGVMRIELPDSFFQRSPLEIKLEYQKRKADSATNGKLLTKAMREKYAKKKPVYRSCGSGSGCPRGTTCRACSPRRRSCGTPTVSWRPPCRPRRRRLTSSPTPRGRPSPTRRGGPSGTPAWCPPPS